MTRVRKRLQQLGRVVTGKTPPTARQELFQSDYLFITPSDLDYNNYFCRSTERTVSEQAKATLPNQFIPADAVMFTCIGATIGKCGIAPAECLTNQQINSVIANDESDPKFLYYLLCNSVDIVKGMGGGAATPIVNKSKFENLDFLVPPLRQQQEIGRILSAYDDLIENNRRRIDLLEQAARMLYREWFVHFRFPGHEHVKIIDGLPEGWIRTKVSDVFVTYLGGTPARGNPNLWGGDVPWINSGEINKLRIVQASEFITEEGISRSAAKLMPIGTTVLAITGATLGQVSYLEIESSANQSVVGVFDEQRKLNELAYLFFKENAQKLILLGSGGAQQHINKEIVNGLDFIKPNESLTRVFQETVAPIFYQIRNLMFQNMKLSEARDLLLPRLMNGEIAV